MSACYLPHAHITGPYTRADIQRVVEQFPSLCVYGFRDVPPADSSLLAEKRILCQVNGCVSFIEGHCAPTKKVRWTSSYDWKHLAERALGQGVYNGAFIAAAILADYLVQRHAPDDSHAVFNVCEYFLRRSAHTSRMGRGVFCHRPHHWCRLLRRSCVSCCSPAIQTVPMTNG
jgi:hypothetical protein